MSSLNVMLHLARYIIANPKQLKLYERQFLKYNREETANKFNLPILLILTTLTDKMRIINTHVHFTVFILMF